MHKKVTSLDDKSLKIATGGELKVERNSSKIQRSSRALDSSPLEFNEFKKRATENADVLQCFGLFTYIDKQIVQPIEEAVKKKASGTVYKLGLPAKEGILVSGSGKKRWCIVECGFLRIYKVKDSKKTEKLQYVICLQELVLRTWPEHKSKQFVFKVQTPTFTKVFTAPTKEEGEDWTWVLLMNSGNLLSHYNNTHRM